MNRLRPFYRIPAIPFVTLGVYFWYRAGLIPVRLSGGRRVSWRNRCLTQWARMMARVLGLRVEIEGPIPEPPFLLVSNHLSYLDIVPLFHTLNCVFIAKKEAGNIPVFGHIVRDMGTLLIDRTSRKDARRITEEMPKEMNEDHGIVFFPEGTTSSGLELLPFRTSLLEIAAISKLPVHYVSLRYETAPDDPPPSESVCWWGEMPYLPHLFRLTSNRAIRCKLRFGTDTVAMNDRKKLAGILHEKVSSLYFTRSEIK